MSQPTLISCSQCGFESPENAKFCRSCGAPLFAESEASSAGTRHYGRQEPLPQRASAALPSQPLPPPSVVDAFGDETRRQAYVPPVVSNTNPFAGPPAPQYGYVPPVPQYNYTAPPPRPSKRRRILKWGAAASALAIAMGIGAAINDNDNNARISPAERNLIEEARREGRLNENMFRGLDDVRSRSNREIENRIRQIEKARDEARRAAERGGQTDLLGIPLLDLSKYEYPQSTVSSAIRIPGKEMTRQHVKTDFASLVRHYEMQMGKPVIFQNGEDENEKRALFQTPGTPEQPSVSVFISESDDYDGQWEVMILRSPFSFPRLGSSGVSLPAVPAPPDPPAPPADLEAAPKGKAPVGSGPTTENPKPAPKGNR